MHKGKKKKGVESLQREGWYFYLALKNQLKAIRLIHSVKWTDKQYKYKNQSFLIKHQKCQKISGGYCT